MAHETHTRRRSSDVDDEDDDDNEVMMCLQLKTGLRLLQVTCSTSQSDVSALPSLLLQSPSSTTMYAQDGQLLTSSGDVDDDDMIMMMLIIIIIITTINTLTRMALWSKKAAGKVDTVRE